MAIAEEPRPPRLPLRRTLGQAYRSVLDRFDVLLHIAWPWLVVTLPFEFAHSWWSHPRTQALSGGEDVPKLPPPERLERLVDPVFLLLLLIPLSAIAVGWHRFLLRDEVPARATLTVDGPVLPYMGMALLFSVVTYLPFLLLEVHAMPDDDSFPTLIFAAVAAFLVAFAIVSRLSVALPAIAIGGPGASLADAWRATRRSTWKLAIGSLLAAVPALAVAMLSASLSNHLDRITYAVVGGVLDVVSSLLVTIGVAFLSYSWRHFYAAPSSSFPSPG